MKMSKKILRSLQNCALVLEPEFVSTGHLSEPETQDNVSMHNFKNTLTAVVRQVGRGGNTKWQ